MTNELTLSRLVVLADRSPALPATAAGLSALPYPLRYALADVLTQVLAGERAALICARRVLDEDESPGAREFAVTQVRDEERHIAFFERALGELGVVCRPLPQLAGLLFAATAAPSLSSLLIGTHLVVETLAHELFADIARVLEALGRAWWVPRRWAAPLGALGKGMQVVYGDESRHVAFGTLRLRALRTEGSAAQRDAVDAQVALWRERLGDCLSSLPVAFFMRPWFRWHVRSVLLRFDARCAAAGGMS